MLGCDGQFHVWGHIVSNEKKALNGVGIVTTVIGVVLLLGLFVKTAFIGFYDEDLPMLLVLALVGLAFMSVGKIMEKFKE